DDLLVSVPIHVHEDGIHLNAGGDRRKQMRAERRQLEGGPPRKERSSWMSVPVGMDRIRRRQLIAHGVRSDDYVRESVPVDVADGGGRDDLGALALFLILRGIAGGFLSPTRSRILDRARP